MAGRRVAGLRLPGVMPEASSRSFGPFTCADEPPAPSVDCSTCSMTRLHRPSPGSRASSNRNDGADNMSSKAVVCS